MARGVNKVILIGNVGTEPEIRYLPSGAAAANFSLATTESWKDKQTGEKQDRTEWHRVSCFNRLGEIIGEYVHKGSKLYVEGSLRTRKWQDKQGQDRYTTEIVASSIQLLDSRTQSPGGNFNEPQQAPAQQYSSAPQQTSAPQARHAQAATAQEAFDDLNDDIPF